MTDQNPYNVVTEIKAPKTPQLRPWQILALSFLGTAIGGVAGWQIGMWLRPKRVYFLALTIWGGLMIAGLASGIWLARWIAARRERAASPPDIRYGGSDNEDLED